MNTAVKEVQVIKATITGEKTEKIRNTCKGKRRSERNSKRSKRYHQRGSERA